MTDTASGVVTSTTSSLLCQNRCTASTDAQPDVDQHQVGMPTQRVDLSEQTVLRMLAERDLMIGRPDSWHHQHTTRTAFQYLVNISSGRQDIPDMSSFGQPTHGRHVGAIQIGIDEHDAEPLVDQTDRDIDRQAWSRRLPLCRP